VAAQQGRSEGNQRRLTQEEMAEQRRQGLCFNCNEKYTRGHNRFCRRLFFLEGVEIDAAADDGACVATDSGETEAPVFSLHAVAGVPIANTIQLQVTVGAASLLALLDSGSTGLPTASSARTRRGAQHCRSSLGRA
jgi:hypothetical protein